jgi:hypothetical protein
LHGENLLNIPKEYDELLPKWMRDLERLSTNKSQIYLYGNVKDSVLFPFKEANGEKYSASESPNALDHSQYSWTLGNLRDALFEFYRHGIGGYEVIAAYNIVDGMIFCESDEDESDGKNRMAACYDEIIKQSEADYSRTTSTHAPQPFSSDDPLYKTLSQIHSCLSNTEVPCVFIVEFSSQLLAAPTHLPIADRLSFLRLLKASSESQQVGITKSASAVTKPWERRTVQNQLILVCDKLNDLPAWLYLNNPFVGSIPIELPRTSERKHYFDTFFDTDFPFLSSELSDLTEGMSYRDLVAIGSVALQQEHQNLKSKALVDRYKYGRQESDWDKIELNKLANAEESLSKRVLGQPAATAAVADVLRRAWLDLSGAQHSEQQGLEKQN